ncbi:MAG: peptidoglycan DD-metalloendopeptidase family protein, partial [Methylococcales bacterium]
ELTGLQSRILQISRTVNNLKTQKSTLIAELKKLDKQYGKSALYWQHLKNQISALRGELKKNQQDIKDRQGQINAQKKSLEVQIRVAYRMGRNDKLKLMLNQQEPAVTGRIMVYYEYLNKLRLKKIEKIDDDLQQLRALKQVQHKENARLNEKLAKSKLEQSFLIKTRNAREQLLAKIKQRFFSKKQQLSQYKTSEKRLKTLILKLQQLRDPFPLEEGAVTEFAKLKGKLPWPVQGRIKKKFGARRMGSRWDGVLIKAKSGTPIHAVTRGRVVYADWLRGYGLLTIIEHGQGYMTLYAFNESLYKSVGDWIEAGTVIATVGQSGGQTVTGLYFGIRKKGKPVNPERWCRKVR